jgi:hypothetical protein
MQMPPTVFQVAEFEGFLKHIIQVSNHGVNPNSHSSVRYDPMCSKEEISPYRWTIINPTNILAFTISKDNGRYMECECLFPDHHKIVFEANQTTMDMICVDLMNLQAEYKQHKNQSTVDNTDDINNDMMKLQAQFEQLP